MSSILWLLEVESREFSRAEKERTACKTVLKINLYWVYRSSNMLRPIANLPEKMYIFFNSSSDTANNSRGTMVSTGRPSDPYEEVITITSKSVDHRSHAYGTCATNGGQPRIRCSIGKNFSPRNLEIKNFHLMRRPFFQF